MKYIKPFVLFIAVAMCGFVHAQHRQAPQPQTARFRPPLLATFLGDHKDSSVISAQDLSSLIGLPLKITDAKNNMYTISSYQFLYKQLAVTEDDSMSGKVILTTYQRASFFRVTPLPAAWVNISEENPHGGEEYLFFDIIVKDAQGRLMYAPNLKLILK